MYPCLENSTTGNAIQWQSSSSKVYTKKIKKLSTSNLKTFFLANDGFTVYKSVPYGPLDEVLPYLSRRVAENRSVLTGARKERDLLASELSRRIFRRNWLLIFVYT